jgi:CRISPR/Cas system-associated exonuclease Cas4 (RecB family)
MISSPWQDHRIQIVPSSSILWDPDRKKAIDLGNLIHAIMEKVICADDLSPVIESYVQDGTLTASNAEWVTERLQQLVTHPKLKPYFTEGHRVLTEHQIVDGTNRIHKPDRLNFTDKDHVVIIDYKTGLPEKKHIYQVQEYAQILISMGFTVNGAYLVYIDKKIMIQNVET